MAWKTNSWLRWLPLKDLTWRRLRYFDCIIIKISDTSLSPSPQAELTRQQNEFKIKLKELEDSLLSRLSSAGGNFLSDTALVENLETTKQTATEIEKKVEEAKVTEKKINEARENYRPAAARASLLYFILNDLEKINPLYQFSLKVQALIVQANN